MADTWARTLSGFLAPSQVVFLLLLHVPPAALPLSMLTQHSIIPGYPFLYVFPPRDPFSQPSWLEWATHDRFNGSEVTEARMAEHGEFTICFFLIVSLNSVTIS